jgi:REP element-mobilizing transposase RayT
MLAPTVRTIQCFPVHADLLDGTVTSIENANLSLKWESSSRKLRDTTHFWARGYFVSTVGRDETVIREYIQHQEQEEQRLYNLDLWR